MSREWLKFGRRDGPCDVAGRVDQFGPSYVAMDGSTVVLHGTSRDHGRIPGSPELLLWNGSGGGATGMHPIRRWWCTSIGTRPRSPPETAQARPARIQRGGGSFGFPKGQQNTGTLTCSPVSSYPLVTINRDSTLAALGGVLSAPECGLKGGKEDGGACYAGRGWVRGLQGRSVSSTALRVLPLVRSARRRSRARESGGNGWLLLAR